MTFLRLAAIIAASPLLRADEPPPAEPAAPSQIPAPAPKWDVSFPEPVSDGAVAEPAPEPAEVTGPLISSHTIQRTVTESPPMPGLPPVTGPVNTTIEVIAPPQLPAPPPLPALPPDDPQVQARLAELSQTYRGTQLAFVSATIYDDNRTLLRIYPNGRADQEVTAWSNVDFNAFTGWTTYRIDHGDGTHELRALLMGIGNIHTVAMQTLAANAGVAYEAPAVPVLPDLGIGGPAFQVVEGPEGSPAMDTLEQLHDLFRKEGARMTAAQVARKQAEAELKAQLLANPPKPADVTIRYWKGNRNETEVAE